MHQEQDTTRPAVLALPAGLTIRQIGPAFERLRAAFAEPGDIVVEIPPDAEADLSFVQLIEASRRYAELVGRRFSLGRPAEGSVLSTLARGGFLTDMTAGDSRFWLHRTAETDPTEETERTERTERKEQMQ